MNADGSRSDTQEVPMTDATATPLYSSLLRRLSGLFYDLIAVVAIVMVVGLVCEMATLGTLIQTGPDTVVPWWYQLLQYLVVVAYFIASWLRGGQTLGMRPWRMRLRLADGRTPLSWKVALTRTAIVSLPLLLPLLVMLHATDINSMLIIMAGVWGVSYAAALFDSKHRALHDMLAGTVLVHERAPQRQR